LKRTRPFQNPTSWNTPKLAITDLRIFLFFYAFFTHFLRIFFCALFLKAQRMAYQLKRLADEFTDVVTGNNMSRENAEREADRLQHLRGGCTDCGCRRFEPLLGTQCQCGDDESLHTFRAPPNFYRPLLASITFPQRTTDEITVFIYAHGCDVPVSTFHSVPQADRQPMYDRTLMLSAVPHSCLNYGNSQTYLTSLQDVYRNHTQSQAEQLAEYQRISQPESIALQGQPGLLTSDPHYAVHRVNFLSARREQLFRIHHPVVEREYDFSHSADDIAQQKQFGIYVVASSKPDDDIVYSYQDQYGNDPISPFSQENNLLSPTLSPSLQKYKTELARLISTPIQDGCIVRLSNILYTLFRVAQPVHMIRVIDLGCRTTCSGYGPADVPALPRMPSFDIERGEEHLGARRFYEKRAKIREKARKNSRKKSKKIHSVGRFGF
jgi:hypothetical protein